ncbi:terminase [Paramagnetospirillum kuznetsovii]|uniref:Terminase n=2 Tax=Paramagnetospirillum kuznetsovii TaxID=2053833 RepID=A0A364NVV9_9PROT|nr:terminase [Paramagnetospirillum kuznetsovii]
MRDAKGELHDFLASCVHDPLRYVIGAYPWGIGDLAGSDGPREWQADILGTIRGHLKNKDTRHEPLRIAVASGHGIGKSALISQIINWAMGTATDCKVVVTANTEAQLRTKTWPEVSKWQRLAIDADHFTPTATAVVSTMPGRDRSWRCDAIPWSEHNTEAFAGLHNQGKRLVLIFDEASAIADRVWEVAEGAMTDEGTEIIWIAFGNPTRASGRFRECFRRHRKRWNCRQIDSRSVEGTNKAQLEAWAEDYGENSDWYKVRVKGEFPSMSVRSLIGDDDVAAAFGRHLRDEQFDFAPKIIGVDPAWSGDDEFVIYLRQGLMSKLLGKWSKNDNDVVMAGIIAKFEDQYKADAVFIDGGYGTGIVSAGRTMNRTWQLVWFSAKPEDLGCLNKRSEMWVKMRDWLKEGGAIEPDDQLREELTGVETVPRLDGKIQLESKEALKARGLQSPNRADALAITFAYPVAMKLQPGDYGFGKTDRCTTEYDPYE